MKEIARFCTFETNWHSGVGDSVLRWVEFAKLVLVFKLLCINSITWLSKIKLPQQTEMRYIKIGRFMHRIHKFTLYRPWKRRGSLTFELCEWPQIRNAAAGLRTVPLSSPFPPSGRACWGTARQRRASLCPGWSRRRARQSLRCEDKTNMFFCVREEGRKTQLCVTSQYCSHPSCNQRQSEAAVTFQHRVCLCFGGQQSVQDVARVSGAGRDETVALQEEAVFRSAPLPAFAHAQCLEQPAARPSSVSVQEDLAEQEAAPWHEGREGRHAHVYVWRRWGNESGSSRIPFQWCAAMTVRWDGKQILHKKTTVKVGKIKCNTFSFHLALDSCVTSTAT